MKKMNKKDRRNLERNKFFHNMGNINAKIFSKNSY